MSHPRNLKLDWAFLIIMHRHVYLNMVILSTKYKSDTLRKSIGNLKTLWHSVLQPHNAISFGTPIVTDEESSTC